MVCLVATRWQGSTITTVRRQVNTEQSHQYHNQLGLGTHIMAPSHTQPAQPVVSAAMSSRQPQPGSSSYLMYGCSLTCSLVTKYFSVYNELFSQCGCECGVHISPAGAPLTRVRRARAAPHLWLVTGWPAPAVTSKHGGVVLVSPVSATLPQLQCCQTVRPGGHLMSSVGAIIAPLSPLPRPLVTQGTIWPCCRRWRWSPAAASLLSPINQ